MSMYVKITAVFVGLFITMLKHRYVKKRNVENATNKNDVTFEKKDTDVEPYESSSSVIESMSSFTSKNDDMSKLLASSVAIVIMGKVGSGRSTVVNIMRPWFSTWGYSTRHLTIANVIGQGYIKGGYSENDIRQLRKQCEEMRCVSPTSYAKLVCKKAWERDVSNTSAVLMVSDISTEAEITYLKSVMKNVIVVHVVNSETSTPISWAHACIRNIDIHNNSHIKNMETLKNSVSRCFAGTIIPSMKGMMNVDKIKECLIKHAIVSDKLTFYDTNHMFSDPNVLFSCMYVLAALIRTKPDLMASNAVIAVSERAVPLASCLAYMLGKRNPSLMFHTYPHDDLVPYSVEWATGKSITGKFAVGWPVHLLPMGSNVILIDDIYSTGQRSKVVRELAKSLGYIVNSTCVLFRLSSEIDTKSKHNEHETNDHIQSVISLITL